MEAMSGGAPLLWSPFFSQFQPAASPAQSPQLPQLPPPQPHLAQSELPQPFLPQPELPQPLFTQPELPQPFLPRPDLFGQPNPVAPGAPPTFPQPLANAGLHTPPGQQQDTALQPVSPVITPQVRLWALLLLQAYIAAQARLAAQARAASQAQSRAAGGGNSPQHFQHGPAPQNALDQDDEPTSPKDTLPRFGFLPVPGQTGPVVRPRVPQFQPHDFQAGVSSGDDGDTEKQSVFSRRGFVGRRFGVDTREHGDDRRQQNGPQHTRSTFFDRDSQRHGFGPTFSTSRPASSSARERHGSSFHDRRDREDSRFGHRDSEDNDRSDRADPEDHDDRFDEDEREDRRDRFNKWRPGHRNSRFDRQGPTVHENRFNWRQNNRVDSFTRWGPHTSRDVHQDEHDPEDYDEEDERENRWGRPAVTQSFVGPSRPDFSSTAR